MNKKLINILLVDDHTMVLEGMKSILANLDFVTVKATASNAFEAIAILRNAEIDIAFVDINLPDISGMDLCTKIKKEFPLVQVIGLSTFKQRSYVSQMMNNGASGYLVKTASGDEIELAIKTIHAGNMYFSSEINNNTQTNIRENEAPTLTRREKEILKLIANGMKSNEIAEKLFLSPFTVDTHRKNLLMKFDVGNTALLINKASNLGLL